MATTEAFQQAVDQVVERAGGNDELLQTVAQAFTTNDPAQVRQVLAEHGGLQLTDDEARGYISEFHSRYQADPNNSRYFPT